MYAEGLSRGRDAQSAGGGEGPGGTGGAVFDCDAGGGESVANLVCLCEILVFTGFGAGGELRVDEFAECFERAGVAARPRRRRQSTDWQAGRDRACRASRAH